MGDKNNHKTKEITSQNYQIWANFSSFMTKKLCKIQVK